MENIENKKILSLYFSFKYFCVFLILFIVEIFIALSVKDNIIRPYVGDLLAVILMYCFIKSLLKINKLSLSLGVLVLAYLIEIFQYLNVLKLLDLERYHFIKIVLGSSFSWGDILAYTIGALLCLIFDKENLK